MSLKSIAEQAAHSLGAAHLIRRKNRAAARILMYHRFPGDLAGLAAQCEHIRRHYHPISLSELAQAARENHTLPPNAVAITIDDGYRDFARAFPIFQRFGLRVTLYVVSGFAAGELWLWPDQLHHLIQNSPLPQADVPVPGGTVHLNLRDRTGAFESFCQTMIEMKNPDRLSVLSSLPALLEAELPRSAPERFAALTWSELRALAADGLDVGAHTNTHPILSSIGGDFIPDEIAGSKSRIEAATGCGVKHFCYPNGKFPDVNETVIARTGEAGFETAVLAEPGLAGPPFHLHRLKRIGVEPDFPPLFFERCVAGYRQ
jgi:peptidoglycan/xylan/chitin deacetylase (PgdA/CDA1 family)